MSHYFYDQYESPMDPYGSWQLQSYGMGPSTNPQADQLKEFQTDANWGAKNIEIGFLGKKELETFPKPAMEEVRRLSKLTGARPSVHGPLDDPAGIDDQGTQNEYRRKGVVKEYEHAMDVAHETGGENTPVVFHASNKLPGAVYTKNNNEKKEAMGVMDRDKRKFVTVVQEEEKETREGKKTWDPDKQLQMLNYTQWTDTVRKLASDRKEMEEIRDRVQEASKRGSLKESDEDLKWTMGSIDTMRSHMDAVILNAYHDLVKYMPDEETLEDKRARHELKQLKRKKEEYLDEHKETMNNINKMAREAFEAQKKGNNLKYAKLKNKIPKKLISDLSNWQHLFSKSVKNPKFTPRKYAPVEEVTRKPAAKTFAETAFNSYKKYGDESPVVTIENPKAPQAFSRADKHKKLVEEARNQLVKLSEEEGKPISRSKAKKLIQATLDTAHYGLWKQYGYSNEDIKDMAEKIAPVTGHLHISDNFGSADSHLPPGWGDLPQGEIQKMLEKKGFKGRTIVEAGGAEAMDYNPFLPSLNYFNSGIYAMGAKPSWTQVGEYFQGSSLYSAPGAPMPSVHQKEYGGGFANLPPMGVPGSGKQKRSGTSGTPYS